MHTFQEDIQHLPLPQQFTYPFHYTPHPLCVMAATEVQSYLQGRTDWHAELQQGKMFGVLVVRSSEGTIGFLTGQSDFKTPGILQKAGVMVALTTDHPVSRIQYLPLCAGLAAKEGMGEWGALRAITVDAARICGVGDRLGSLKEGKDGDIVLYDGDPLQIASSVKATIINGKIVWKSEEAK